MSEQDRQVTDNDALKAFRIQVERASRQACDLTDALRRMTGADLHPEWIEGLAISLDWLRRDVRLAVLAADDLRRRAANPRDEGQP